MGYGVVFLGDGGSCLEEEGRSDSCVCDEDGRSDGCVCDDDESDDVGGKDEIKGTKEQ